MSTTLNQLLWLTTRSYLREGAAQALVEHFGSAEAVYYADPSEYDMLRLPRGLKESLRDKSMDRPERILEDCDRLDLWIMTYQDALYPERLHQLKDYPLVLYGRGKRFRFDEELAVGMVGTRKCSSYGEQMAGRLGLELARAGALLVSGIAQGIDTCALRGALRGGGPVVSVLGGGIDVIYPAENKWLYEDVAAAGALLSEYPPGTDTHGSHFPVRNRIISGLTLGVVVVEAPERSGALITARQALDQGRDVFAVPGPADAPMSAGTNGIIKRGQAKLVHNAEDILIEFAHNFPRKLRPAAPLLREEADRRLGHTSGEAKPPAAPEAAEAAALPTRPRSEWESLGDEQREIFHLLSQRPLVPDELVGRTDIPARRVNTALTLLQAGGYIEELPGKRFCAAVRFDTAPE